MNTNNMNTNNTNNINTNNMNTNNMDDYNIEEYIREPDQVRTDRLINESVYNPIYDIETVLEQSRNEYSHQIDIEEQKQIEQILIQQRTDIEQEQKQKQKQNKFSNTKIQLHKMSLFDQPNLYYYELALSIIEMYNNNYITEYIMKSQEHANLFHIIKLIRIPINELNDLQKLIITE
jgi:hypothetical protein